MCLAQLENSQTSKFLAGNRSGRQTRRKSLTCGRRRRVTLEFLEERTLLSAANIVGTTLEVVADGSDETIALRLSAGDVAIVEVDDGNDGTSDHAFNRSLFDRIRLDGAGGNDSLLIDESNGIFTDSELTTLIGGEGNDTLVGASGAEVLSGGLGDDMMDGGPGTDRVVESAETDFILTDTRLSGLGDDVLRSIEEADLSAPDLLSYFSAEGSAVDAASGSDGTLMNGVTFAPGQVGQAFSFDGVDDFVRLPNDFIAYPLSGATSNQPLSFAAWFQTSSGGVILGQQAGDPFGSLAGGYVPAVYVGTDGLLRVELFWKGFAGPIVSPGTVNDGAFHHVAVTDDGATETVYLDGVAIGSSPHTQVGYAFGYNYQLGTGFASGWPASNDDWYSFNGQIDEVEFTTRALSAANVQAIYNAGVAHRPIHENMFDSSEFTGAATLDGGPGNDTLVGGSGADCLIGGGGNDSLSGGGGDDFLLGDTGNDILRGGDGSDLLDRDSGPGNDTLDGGADVDALYLNGIDSVDGGAGNDILNMISDSQGAFFVTAHGRNVDVSGPASSTTPLGAVSVEEINLRATDLFNPANKYWVGDLSGTTVTLVNVSAFRFPGAIAAASFTGTLTLEGTAAADNISVADADLGYFGPNPTVTLPWGRVGFGFLPGSSGRVILQGLGANDTIQVDAAANLAGVQLYLKGGAGNDRLVGGSGDELLDGGPGDDMLLAGIGNDTLIGGDGNDVLDGGGGDGDTVDFSGATRKVVVNLAAAAPFAKGQGRDMLVAMENAIGSPWNDKLIGNAMANRLIGAGGNDTITGDGGGDTLVGGDGNDLLAGGTGMDSLDGGNGDDLLRGGEGDDTLTGTAGIDRLFGDAGFDELFVDLFDPIKQGEVWAFLSDTTWRAIGPLGNLEGNPINSVGTPWEVTVPGWNTDLGFNDSAATGWSSAILNDGFPGNIWVNGNGEGGSTPAYFRLEFDIPAPLAATLEGGVDDDAQVYINGSLVVDDHDGGAADFAPLDVTAFLHAGRNLIAVKAHDSFGLHEALRLLLRVQLAAAGN